MINVIDIILTVVQVCPSVLGFVRVSEILPWRLFLLRQLAAWFRMLFLKLPYFQQSNMEYFFTHIAKEESLLLTKDRSPQPLPPLTPRFSLLTSEVHWRLCELVEEVKVVAWVLVFFSWVWGLQLARPWEFSLQLQVSFLVLLHR